MLFEKQCLFTLVVVSTLLNLVSVDHLLAQPITRANDGTNTTVTRNGNRFNIRGGTLSRDGANLFHSFGQFGLGRGQVANFLSNPQIHNILGRVVGGNPSAINGLIQLTGGNSNLYLINPAGILFGPDASLDLPASFFATTATGIGFENGWLSSIASGDYAALIGDPNSFVFNTPQPGSILNEGQLSVTLGQSLMLLGGTVVNTGTLTAPGGSITIAAIPGEHRVRLSQTGMVLNLELETIGSQIDSSSNTENLLPFTPLLLPELLTGGTLTSATSITVNPDGSIRLFGSSVDAPATPGTAIASGVIDTANSQSLTTDTPEINVIGDRVALINTRLDASSPNQGGTVRIGGDYQGQGTVPNADFTYIDRASIINADGIGSADAGRVIVWADNTTQFLGNINARGGSILGNGGFAEVSGKDNLVFRGNVDLSAANGTVGSLLLDPVDITIVDASVGVDDAQITDNRILSSDAGTAFTISEDALEGLSGNASISLAATNNITIEDLTDNTLNFATLSGNGRSVTFTAGNTFSMEPGDTIQTQGGNVNISGQTLELGGIQIANVGLDAFRSVTLTGNEINLLGGSNSVQVVGTNTSFGGTITLRPLATNQDIVVGGTNDSNPGTLDITNSDLSALSLPRTSNEIIVDGFSSNGNITVVNPGTPLQLEETLRLQTQTGLIRVEGSIQAPEIRFRANELDLVGEVGSIATNSVTFESGLSSQNIRFGDSVEGDPTALEITTADWQRINLGGYSRDLTSPTPTEPFTSINIGSNNSGTITVLSPITAGSINIGSINNSGTITVLSPITANSISFRADEIDLLSGVNSIQGRSSISFGVGTSGQNIIVGGTDNATNALDITVDDLAAVQATDLTSISIGQFFSSGNTQSGTLSVAGPIRARSITLVADEINLEALVQANSVTLQTASLNQPEITIGGSSDTGALDITANDLTFLRSLQGNTFPSLRVGSQFTSANTSIRVPRADSPLIFDNSLTLTAGGTGSITVDRDLRANGNVDLTTSGTGSITINQNLRANNNPTLEESGDINLASNNSIAINQNLIADGNIELRANEIDLQGGDGSVRTTSNGTITLRPSSSDLSQDIALGGTADSGTETLDLTADELSALRDGFSRVSIGLRQFNDQRRVAAFTGDISVVGNVNLSDPLSLLTDTGEISFQDTVTLRGQGSNLSLNTGTGLATAGLGSIVLNGGINIPGNLTFPTFTSSETSPSVTLGGNITASGTIKLDFPLTFSRDTTLRSRTGPILLSQPITTTSELTLNAQNNIRTSNITATGAIAITSSSGEIFTGDLDAADLTLSAQSNITTSNITAIGGINLTSQTGAIVTGNLNTSNATQGSPISIRASDSITTGTIDSSSTNGNGGAVLLDPTGDIQVTSINTQGGDNGSGGDIEIQTGRFFRATGTFTDRNGQIASLSSAGGVGNGSIRIRHGGGSTDSSGPITPFVVGDSQTNGTAGAITTGAFSIASGSFRGDYSLGNIRLRTSEPSGTTDTPDSDEDIVRNLPAPNNLSSLGTPIATLEEAQDTLKRVSESTGIEPALIYARFVPSYIPPIKATEQSGDEISERFRLQELIATEEVEQYYQRPNEPDRLTAIPDRQSQYQACQDPDPERKTECPDNYQLELLLVTATGEPLAFRPSGVNWKKVRAVANQFRNRLAQGNTPPELYLPPAQQLHEWLIAPLEQELKNRKIQNLSFVMDAGLRAIPLAALHDGQQFLIEKGYSVGLMPSLSLTNTRLGNIKESQVLAMGASEFSDHNLLNLPGVPEELSAIHAQWPGPVPRENENFTLEAFRNERRQTPLGIIHLATHADLRPGDLENSYIQFWDQRLPLNRLRELNLYYPPVELLTLSACRTALGDEKAELGFAGLASQIGVKSVLSSLWYISDHGTLQLMTDFYQYLDDAPIKAEALRQAQLALLRSQVSENAISDGAIAFQPSPQANLNLSHPYYWSAFTIVGNPW